MDLKRYFFLILVLVVFASACIQQNPITETTAGTSAGTEITQASVSKIPEKTVLMVNTSRAELDWSPDGSKVAASLGEDVMIWDTYTGDAINRLSAQNLKVGEDSINKISWSPDGSMLGVVYSDGLRIFDPSSSEEFIKINTPEFSYSGFLGWSPDGKRIISAFFNDNKTYVWDAASGNELISFDVQSPNLVVLSWDGKNIAVSDGFGNLKVFDIGTGKMLSKWKVKSDDKNYIDFDLGVQSMSWGREGILASIGDQTTKIYDTSGKQIKSFSFSKGNDFWKKDSAATSDGKRVAVDYRKLEGDDAVVAVWDVSTNVKVKEFQYIPWSDKPTKISLSPDGKRIALLFAMYYDEKEKGAPLIIWRV